MIGMASVGVIGMGFVGGSIYRGFALHADVYGYDIDSRRSTSSFDDVAGSSYIFIALPTPMATVEGGNASIDLIREAVRNLIDSQEYYGQPIVIKSTIPPGTTDALNAEFGTDSICHSPEFLTERSALADFLTPSRHIIGAASRDVANDVELLYASRFPGVPILKMSPLSAELVKYGANCFFATKVIFFNELYMISGAIGADWDDVMCGIMTDGRIGHSHNQVPGHDGSFGFGGKCFPKDLNALIAVAESAGIDPILLKAAWQQNLAIRINRDWANIHGAVVGN